jgi:cysteine-rich repeat protein
LQQQQQQRSAAPATLTFLSPSEGSAIVKTLALTLADKSQIGSCGDGKVDEGEECDDGNYESKDGCGQACKVETGWVCAGTVPSVCSRCGNGIREGTENCDDGNTSGGDGCSVSCAVEPGFFCSSGTPNACQRLTAEAGQVCGDAAVQGTETCDDGNVNGADGCSPACAVEPGWSCAATANGGSTCSKIVTQVCGNGALESPEVCDDGNTSGGDGCSSQCKIDPGWSCTYDTSLRRSVCTSTTTSSGGGSTTPTPTPTPAAGSTDPPCGNGKLDSGESCDDGDTFGGDGCSADCFIEAGHTCDCSVEPCLCTASVCGNGILEGGEVCDDGNTFGGDGCAADCRSSGGTNTGGTAVCGNGVREAAAGETCDDGNLIDFDGCEKGCKVQPGWTCDCPPTNPCTCTQDTAAAGTRRRLAAGAAGAAGAGLSTRQAAGTVLAPSILRASAVYSDGEERLFLYGGLVNNALSRDVYVVDLSNLRAASPLGIVRIEGISSPRPPALVDHASVLLEDRSLVITGGSESIGGAPTSAHWLLDTREFTWSVLPSQGFGRRAHHALVRAASIGGYIAYGGIDAAGRALDTAVVFRDNIWQPIPLAEDAVAPPGRSSSHVTHHGNVLLYVYGGIANDGSILSDLWELRASSQGGPATWLERTDAAIAAAGGGGGRATLTPIAAAAVAYVSEFGGQVVTYGGITELDAGASQASISVARRLDAGAIRTVSSSAIVHNVACPSGMAADGVRNWECHACVRGTSQPDRGTTSCLSCAIGTFAVASGLTACTKCPSLATTDSAGASTVSACRCIDLEAYQTNADGSAAGATAATATANETSTTTTTTTTDAEDDDDDGDNGDGAAGNDVDSKIVQCAACPVGALCRSGTVEPLPGFTRSSSDPTFMLQCSPPDACLGADGGCAEGYGGVRCGSCATEPVRHYRLGTECRECPDVQYTIVGAIAGAVGIAFVILLYNISAGGSNFGSVSITLHFFQVNEIIGSFQVAWPDSLRRFFDIFSVFSFNVSLVAPECSGPFTYFDRWKLVAALPLVFAAFFGVVVLIVVAQSYIVRAATGRRPRSDVFDRPHFGDAVVSMPKGGRRDEYRSAGGEKNGGGDGSNGPGHGKKSDSGGHGGGGEVDDAAMSSPPLLLVPFKVPVHLHHFFAMTCNATLLAITLLWIPILGSCLEYFDCTRNGDGSRSLDADVTIDCDTNDEYLRLFPLAVCVTVFYVIGTPLLLVLVLRKGRREHRLGDPRFAAYCGTLYDRYDSAWYWFELVVLVRKALLVLCRTFLTTKTLLQLVGGLAVCFAALFVEVYAYPFARTVCNRLDVFLLVANVLLLFGGLLFYAQGRSRCESDDDDTSACLFPDSATERALIGILLTVLFVALFLALLAVLSEARAWLRKRRLEKGNGKLIGLRPDLAVLADRVLKGGVYDRFETYFETRAGVRGRRALKAMLRNVAPATNVPVWDNDDDDVDDNNGNGGGGGPLTQILKVGHHQGPPPGMAATATGPRTEPRLNSSETRGARRRLGEVPRSNTDDGGILVEAQRVLDEGRSDNERLNQIRAMERERRAQEVRGMIQKTESRHVGDMGSGHGGSGRQIPGVPVPATSTRSRPGSGNTPYFAPPAEPYIPGAAVPDDNDDDYESDEGFSRARF